MFGIQATLTQGTFVSTAKVTAHAGGGQASATQLSASDSLITTCATAGDSVKLKAATVGAKMTVRNEGVASANIFPQSTENIIGLAANAALPLGTASSITFVCFTAGEWQY